MSKETKTPETQPEAEERTTPRTDTVFNYPQPDGAQPIVVIAKDREEADNKLKEKLKQLTEEKEHSDD